MGISAASTLHAQFDDATAAARVEIARSEQALRDLLRRSERLHGSHLAHTAGSCLLCFADA
ncbi:hypothetical protein K8Z61_00515 [Nocardioides sp. TRM66260-LWL]|uniref:hypothetical protein n=1 Tax=Nocardioides sp. TRM66260-LWL TaxID=2874478 RepID=UPI001CC73893|nr:hypothetical protein [Nocardioides sp. TRM66260-LWL]MBZ5732969.1 hypothetical protein [Nocardioides sp. TRM66260-LWL]